MLNYKEELYNLLHSDLGGSVFTRNHKMVWNIVTRSHPFIHLEASSSKEAYDLLHQKLKAKIGSASDDQIVLWLEYFRKNNK